MKKFLLFFTLSLFTLIVSAQNTALVYASNDPYSTCAAAIVDQKYSLTYILDVNTADSAAQYAWWATVTDSVTYCYVAIDTTLNYTANKFKGAIFLTLKAKIKYGYSMNYYVGTATLTKAEQAWNAIYTGITMPGIVSYLSDTGFGTDKADASGGTTSQIFKANATGWVNDGFNTGYTVYITAGPGIGQSKVISDTKAVVAGDADTLVVTGTFTTAITSASDFTILTTSQFNRVGWYDMYAYYAVLTRIPVITTYSDQWKRLLDSNSKLNAMPLNSGRSVPQDAAYRASLLLEGKAVWDYLVVAANN